MPYALLPQRALIRLSGADAVPFLQGLLSNDVGRAAARGEAVYAALLSPQGRFLHDMLITAQNGALLLDVDRRRRDDLLARLRLYRLRAAVEIEALPEAQGVVALWEDEPPPAGGLAWPDPRVAMLGWRLAGDTADALSWCAGRDMRRADADAYERHRLALGVPDGAADMIPDKSLLLEFGFEDLHGVDFAKGCYVGQEVTARSKHRGQLRRFLYQLHGEAVLPAPGSPVYRNEAAVGELRSVEGDIGLGLLRIEEVARAEKGEGTLRCGDIVLKAALPQWITRAPEAVVRVEN